MTEWTFRLTLRGIELTDEQLDTLYEAGCDDGSFSVEPDGTVLGFFDREAPTEQDAVISAIVDVEQAGIGARVLQVEADDDWLTASEIAARVGRSRQSVALLARGDRGPETSQPPSPAGSHRTHSLAGLRSNHGSSATTPAPCLHPGRSCLRTSSPRSMTGLTFGNVFGTLPTPHGGQS